MNAHTVLVADAGGTNVRFAKAPRPGETRAVQRYPVTAHATFEAALQAYLEAHPVAGPITAMAIAAAGPVAPDGSVQLTNGPWYFSRSSVSDVLGGAEVWIGNDLEGVSAALPRLAGGDLDFLRGAGEMSSAGRRQRMMAVNVGTGFGASLVVPVACGGRTFWQTVPSESGHLSLAAAGICDLDHEAFLLTEDALSGRGIAALYRALGGTVEVADAAAVFARCALEDAVARRVVDVMSGLLGRIAGDLVLATGAWGGAYLCGSVVNGWRHVAEPQVLLDAFDAKGRMRPHMSEIPVAVIRRDEPALFGLSYIAHDLLTQD